MSDPIAGKPGAGVSGSAKPGIGPARAAATLDPAAATRPATIKCPKCGTDVREVARFCQRCHHTMRYECPACRHSQREGGKCEKCGVDFLKYISAVVSAKKAEADVLHDRFEQRSSFLKNILWIPFTLGIPLIRDYFVKRDRRK